MFGFLFVASSSIAAEYPEPGVYQVAGNDSDIRVLVYRAGLLSGFGHNHTISTSDIQGRMEIRETSDSPIVELVIPVEGLEVDNEAIRLEEGESFKKKVSDKDKRGTRENMLGAKLLNGTEFPHITFRLLSWTGELPEVMVTAEITVKDQVSANEFPASVRMIDGQIVVTGSLFTTQTHLGLVPFTAVLGSLRVRNAIEIKFRIAAQRVRSE